MRLPTTARPQQQPPCQRALLQLQQRHGRAPLTSTTKHPRPLNTKPPLPCNPPPSPLPWRAPLGAAQHQERPPGQRVPLQLRNAGVPSTSTTKPPRVPSTSTTKPPRAPLTATTKPPPPFNCHHNTHAGACARVPCAPPWFPLPEKG